MIPEDGGRGDSHIEMTGVLVVPFRGYKHSFGTSSGVQPQKVHSGSFCSNF